MISSISAVLVFLLQVLLLLWPMSPCLAQEEDGEGDPSFEYKVATFKHAGIIQMAASGDINGDGRNDLLLFHKPRKEAYEKFCSIYLQQSDGFLNEPHKMVPLGESITAVDIEDIDSDGKDELCGFDGEGMTIFEFDEAGAIKSRQALKFVALLPGAGRQIVLVNWIEDIDSDGNMDLLLPVVDGLHLFKGTKEGDFVESRMFDFAMKSSVHGEGGQNYVSYRMPRTDFADYNGDGHTDVGLFDVERMDFFLTEGSSEHTKKVSAPLLTEFTQDFIGGSGFRDLNADSIPDAVIVLMSQKKNLQSEVRIYIANEEFSYGTEPTNMYAGDESLILPMFLDVTGDGKMEMLLQNINVGFGFFINYFLANRIGINGELRKLSEDGRYEEEPTIKRAFYIRASETGTEPARGIGDFNGDGLDDLVVGTMESRLSFFLANEADLLPKRASHEIDVSAYGNMTILNLNDDERDDIIILYPQDDKNGEATLLLSK